MKVSTILEAYYTGKNSKKVLKGLLEEVADTLECPQFNREEINCGGCVKCKAKEIVNVLEEE